MKRLASSDSLGGLISLCSSADEKATTANATSGNMYNRGGFQHILDGLEEEAGMEDSGGHIAEKKRRLSVEQVKALEKNFEVENKLEPERKVKLAQELSLQPRQVAVWFQNRRARWKTKQLEKDYSVLKANYDSLKLNFDALQHDKEALMAELQELKGKLKDKNEKSCNGPTIKEEISQETGLETEEATNLASDQSENKASFVESKSLNNEDLDNNSDSSAVLDDNSPQHNVLSSGAFNNPMMVSSSSASSLINCFEFSDMRVYGGGHKGYQHQFLRMEEHNFLSSGEESCNFFSDEQAPSLPWYCGEPWN